MNLEIVFTKTELPAFGQFLNSVSFNLKLTSKLINNCVGFQSEILAVQFQNILIEVLDKVLVSKKYYCQKISNSLYRGSELNAEQLKLLANKGIKTIINLKKESKLKIEEYVALCQKYDIDYVNIPINPFKKSEQEINNVMSIIKESTENSPVYVHCKFGKDRTGLVSALYRISEMEWTVEEAFEEMQTYGYSFLCFPKLKELLFEYAKNSCL